MTNPNIGIVYRPNTDNGAGFLNVLDAVPIKENSIPNLLVCGTPGIETGTITYYAESNGMGTETLTINFNDNTATRTGNVNQNTTTIIGIEKYYIDTGYGNIRIIRVEDIWSDRCQLDFYTSVYSSTIENINNVYEGAISQIATRAYVDTKEFNYATEEDVLYILNEIGAIKPVTTTDGRILTDNNGAIYSL